MMHLSGHARTLCLVLALPLMGGSAFAQQAPPPTFEVGYPIDTGEIENSGAVRDVIASYTVFVQGATSVQLTFDEVRLAGDVFKGDASILRVTSHRDGAVQELNRFHVAQWQRKTAYFNGDTVQVDLIASPGTGINRLRLASVLAEEAPLVAESQCGPTDDRLPSSDPRSARIVPVGCTGWLINDCNQCFLTAGHCLGGGLTTVEFNVPASNGDGSLNHPGPDDQYAIDTASMQGIGGGVGADWGYYGTFPNPNTGLTAGSAQGMTFVLEAPQSLPGNQNIRITGFGTDSSPLTRNQVQQTHVGPWILLSGSRLSYQTDTTGGNSGSPVIWEEMGTAIGIHTHGGCSSTSGNNGTALGFGDLQTALANPQGVCRAGIQLLSAAPTVLEPGIAGSVDLSIGGQVAPGTAMLHVRYDGGAFIDVPLSAGSGGAYQATLPAPVCGATPEYYFSADIGSCGGTVTLPENAPSEVFSASVGTRSALFTDDMETDQGWELTPGDDTASTGIWERVDPIGTAAQPEDDHTPGGATTCWVTGQGSVGGAVGENDVDGGRTTLLSPTFDMTGTVDPYVAYWRWYSNNQGGGTPGDVFRISLSDDNGASWVLADPVGPISFDSTGGWFYRELRITDFVTPSAQVRIRYRASDFGDGSIVEAAVDDFQTFDLTCSVALADCNGNFILDADDIASGRSQDSDGNGVPDECGGLPGSEYCFCTSGPCGNDSAFSGCVHSGGLGARTVATGTTSVAADDLVLTSFDVPTNRTGLIFMGAGQIQTPFGDGQQCVGAGGVGIFRYPFQNSGGSGTFVLGPGLAALSAQRFPAAGQISSGQTWNFQSWFRDPMGPCGNGFTTSSALSVTFTP